MVTRLTRGRVSQAVTNDGQLPDLLVKCVGTLCQQLTIHHCTAPDTQHPADLIEREPGRSAQSDQGDLIQHLGVVLPTQSAATRRANQSLLFIEPQRRRYCARSPGHLADVHPAPLDLKST